MRQRAKAGSGTGPGFRLAVVAAILLTAGVAAGAAARAAAPRKGAATPSRHLCGWIDNPTPGNWWLVDRSGEWEMGVQGGHQAQGMDTLPDLTEHDWKVTNGSSYGHVCGCLDAQVDRRNRRIVAFRGFRQLPLRTCRMDPALRPR